MTADTLHGSAFSVGRHPRGSVAGGLPRGSQHGSGRCRTVGVNLGSAWGRVRDIPGGEDECTLSATSFTELERERTRRAVAAAAGVLRHRTPSLTICWN